MQVYQELDVSRAAKVIEDAGGWEVVHGNCLYLEANQEQL
jgi:hypothetical protein